MDHETDPNDLERFSCIAASLTGHAHGDAGAYLFPAGVIVPPARFPLHRIA